MIKALIAALILIMASTCWYLYYKYPPVILERAAQHSLDHFARVVATKNRPAIASELKALLTDASHIHLDVTMHSLSHPGGAPAYSQDFDKTAFLSFVDNILYSLDDYSYEGNIREFHLSQNHQEARATIISQELADGISYYAGAAIQMHFSSGTHCYAAITFEQETPQITAINCTMELSSLPNSGQENTLRNTDVLREMLR